MFTRGGHETAAPNLPAVAVLKRGFNPPQSSRRGTRRSSVLVAVSMFALTQELHVSGGRGFVALLAAPHTGAGITRVSAAAYNFMLIP